MIKGVVTKYFGSGPCRSQEAMRWMTRNVSVANDGSDNWSYDAVMINRGEERTEEGSTSRIRTNGVI